MGISDFVLCVKKEDKAEFDMIAERFKSIIEVVKSYKVEGKENEYWVIQLEAMYDSRSMEELCKFVFRYFPFVAMRQKGSTYILVPNAQDFRVLLNTYGKERKLYFLYDMLSISDRYDAACEVGEINSFCENRLIHQEGNNTYSLIFDSGCLYLFTDEPEITVMDETTGIVKELDITEGLHIFKFHVAVLK